MKIYGRHAALEALNNPYRVISEIWIDDIEILPPVFRSKNIHITNISKQFPKFQNPQGIVIETEPLKAPNLDDLTWQVVILDQVTDPQNLGAVVRSAAVLGVQAIITQDYQGLLDSSVMARVASGGLEHVGIIPVVNIGRTIEALKKNGYWSYGFTGDGNHTLHKTRFEKKSALVIGAEDKGIRPLVLEKCDFLVKIQSQPNFSVLNASHAASIAIYEATRQCF